MSELKNARILIVDDFMDMRMSLQRMLGSLSSRVDLATNGEDAISKMKATNYAIILCDYNLGAGKDGQQVLEEAKHLGLIHPAAIFVMITAESSIPGVLGAIEYQPDDYITKPFSKDLLLHRIQRAVGRKQELREIFVASHDKDYKRAVAACEQKLQTTDSRYMKQVGRLLGELYLESGDYKKALDYYQQYATQQDFPWAKFGAAKARYFLGQYEEAIEAFDALWEEDRFALEAYDWSAKCSEALGDKVKAQETLMLATSLSPKIVPRQRTLGRIALENDDLNVAVGAFRSAVRNGEHSCYKSAEEYVSLSDIYVKQGDALNAARNLKAARKSLEDSPNDLVQVLVAEAGMSQEQGKKADAEAAMKNAARVYERFEKDIRPEVSLGLLKALLKNGGSEELAKSMAQSLACNNHDDKEYLAEIRGAFAEVGASDEVLSSVAGALKEYSIIDAQGVQLVKEGNLKEALALFESAAQKVPSNKSFNLNAAQVLLMLMKKNGANEPDMDKVGQYLRRVELAGKADQRHAQLLKAYRSLEA